MNDLPVFTDFESASRAVLSFLHARIGFDLWMVTRTEGGDSIVLYAEDHGYGITDGTVFRWSDSCCSRMVAGLGPHIAPNVNAIPAYADAPILNRIPVKAYIGVPLNRPDGTLFGTLCAIHPSALPATILAEEPLVRLLAAMLSALLHKELECAMQHRLAERAEQAALTDPLTGLHNRRGWDQLLTAEDSRCRRYGNPACVIFIDLDGFKRVNDTQGHEAGDALLKQTAAALQAGVRGQDIVARVGGDEFAVLGVECDETSARTLVNRISSALIHAGISASLGYAPRRQADGLPGAYQAADQAMYAAKKAKQSAADDAFAAAI